MMLEKLGKEPETTINVAFKSSVLQKLSQIAKEKGYDSRKEFMAALFEEIVREWEACQK